MPWQKLIEHGAEFGTAMILDVLAFNALSGFSRTAGRAVVTEINNALENGLLLSKNNFSV